MEPPCTIYTVLFGDTSANIVRYMPVRSLYNLSLSCKKFNCKTIGKKIKDNVIDEIHLRIRRIFYDDTDEFMRALKADSGAVVGSLITQIMLGEIWNDEDMCVCIPRLTANSSVNRFMNQKYEKMELSGLKNRPDGCDIVRNFYAIHGYGVSVHQTDCDERDVDSLRCANAEYCPDNHIYYLKTNELRIHQIHWTLAKQIMLPLHPMVFETMFKRGFSFCCPERYTNTDAIFVQKKRDVVVNRKCRIINNAIFEMGVNPREMLRIVNKAISKSDCLFHIRECCDNSCRYMNRDHFHCELPGRHKNGYQPVLLLCE